MTGGVAFDNPYPNPAPDWLTDRSWSEIVRASELPNLDGLMESMITKAFSYNICLIILTFSIVIEKNA